MNQRSLTQPRVVSGNLKTGRPSADSALIGHSVTGLCAQLMGATALHCCLPTTTSCPKLPAAPKQEVMSHTGTLQEATDFFQAKHLRNNGSNAEISVEERRGKGQRTQQGHLCPFYLLRGNADAANLFIFMSKLIHQLKTILLSNKSQKRSQSGKSK